MSAYRRYLYSVSAKWPLIVYEQLSVTVYHQHWTPTQQLHDYIVKSAIQAQINPLL